MDRREFFLSAALLPQLMRLFVGCKSSESIKELPFSMDRLTTVADNSDSNSITTDLISATPGDILVALCVYSSNQWVSAIGDTGNLTCNGWTVSDEQLICEQMGFSAFAAYAEYGSGVGKVTVTWDQNFKGKRLEVFAVHQASGITTDPGYTEGYVSMC